jgi:ATPase subunit of ABC transporter with duplicated ATPase domains
MYSATELGIGYVEQIHAHNDNLSGGQRVNQALSQALSMASDLLLLDEPTNHLDADNRRSLTRMLSNYHGSIVLVTHDDSLMDQVCDTIWHISNGRIATFDGRFSDYLIQQQLERDAVERQLSALKRAQHDAHNALMKEQERSSHAKQRGIQSIKQSKWATIKSPTKLARGNTTSGRKLIGLKQHRNDLVAKLDKLPRDFTIQPQFYLPNTAKSSSSVVQITNGAVGYAQVLLEQLFLNLVHGERVALTGKNGSGKSTLARAIAGDTALLRTGEWFVPAPHEIGYLDQHYANLNPQRSVIQTLADVVPKWTELELRRHLSDFLFRQNGIIKTQVSMLSGGEKARLALACIAARPPQLLILDEITNNLDRRMRQHVIDILTHYPGTLLLISHDESFLDQIGRVRRHPL